MPGPAVDVLTRLARAAAGRGEADDPTAPLWRGAVVFRVLTLAFAVGLQVVFGSSYARPWLGWAVVAAMVGWTVLTSVGYTSGRGRTAPVVTADAVVVLALMALSPLVLTPAQLASPQPLPTTVWAAGAVVSAAVRGGPVRAASDAASGGRAPGRANVRDAGSVREARVSHAGGGAPGGAGRERFRASVPGRLGGPESVAVEVGFEPTDGLPHHTLSRRTPSAARRLHRAAVYPKTNGTRARLFGGRAGCPGWRGFYSPFSSSRTRAWSTERWWRAARRARCRPSSR